MTTLLKDQFFNPSFYDQLTKEIFSYFPYIDAKKFRKELENDMHKLELNDRVKKAAEIIDSHIKGSLEKNLPGLTHVAKSFKGLYSGMVFPKYVELQQGNTNLETTFKALEIFTQYSSSEFAIRPLLRDFPKATLAQMTLWSVHENEHVRRLSSEGLRPLLPWSFKLTPFLNYPEVSYEVLNNLKNDPSLYVRKSVGNHLNDLSKLAPKATIDIVKSWDTPSERTSWIIKKGLRSLIKQGYPEVFQFYGYEAPSDITVKKLTFSEPKIIIGSSPTISLELHNNNKCVPIILDFKITYRKQKGKQSSKVFKWKEIQLDSGTTVLKKKLSFKQMSTRKHYPGLHSLSIIINGTTICSESFQLIASE